MGPRSIPQVGSALPPLPIVWPHVDGEVVYGLGHVVGREVLPDLAAPRLRVALHFDGVLPKEALRADGHLISSNLLQQTLKQDALRPLQLLTGIGQS